MTDASKSPNRSAVPRASSRAGGLVRVLRKNFRYALMRGLARFKYLRQAVVVGKRIGFLPRKGRFQKQYQEKIDQSIFAKTDKRKIVAGLRKDGVAMGLKLPQTFVSEILDYARKNPCYADRDPRLGFVLDRREEAEKEVGKSILVAQYFNTTRQCRAIERITNDPLLRAIACEYLQSEPTLVGTNLWWTFPVSASQLDRDRHAHVFHRDIDDFRFFKFFFYITDVKESDGGHICVLGSHRNTPKPKSLSDRWRVRRYSDEEITNQYSQADIKEICGRAGDGFAENTFCVHKGLTPTESPRLMLQLQFALFDYGVMNDHRSPELLRQIA